MNAYTKIKRQELPKTSTGRRCRLHLTSSGAADFRFASVWPRVDRKSGFHVSRYSHNAGGLLGLVYASSFRRARVIAKRFVEGCA